MRKHMKKRWAVIVFAVVWCAGAHVEFGVPTFIGLLIFAMFSCGTGEKWSSQASAYSVFNDDGNRIAGTMSAEQIDGQMRNGGHAVRQTNERESTFVQTAVRGWGGGIESVKRAPPTDDPLDPAEMRRRRSLAAEAAQVRALGGSS